MEKRIKVFMEVKGINAAELADTISVQRSNVSHVLNGRNKPSSIFIEKLLKTYPDLNARWLLLGEGEMLQGRKPSNLQEGTDDLIKNQLIFKEENETAAEEEALQQYEKKGTPDVKEEKGSGPEKTIEEIAPILKNSANKEVESIVIFYSDKTFVAYNPR